jgi:hypothetical protein
VRRYGSQASRLNGDVVDSGIEAASDAGRLDNLVHKGAGGAVVARRLSG